MTKTEIIEKYRAAAKKLVLLDYDGTLVNFAPSPDKALPNDDLLAVLQSLANTPGGETIVITGRGHKDIERILSHVPVDIIACHGAMARENGKWWNRSPGNCTWKKDISPIVDEMALNCPGSFVEEKQFSLGWHYRNAPAGYAASRELIRKLQNIAALNHLRIMDGNAIVEIMDECIGKGKAIENLMDLSGYDFILCIGDDKTDEDMFDVLLKYENAITIKAGPGNTFAKFRLNTVEDVILFLKTLDKPKNDS